MKKEITEVDKKRGIYQVTTCDERWYAEPVKDRTTGLPAYKFYPSVTWITFFYHKPTELIKWIAARGYEEAEAVKQLAGEKGSKIHLAVEKLLSGEEFNSDTKVMNKSKEQEEELTGEEYGALVDFSNWFAELQSNHKVKVIAVEKLIISKKYGYAGMVDIILDIDEERWIIDLKTGQTQSKGWTLQLSAYKHAYLEAQILEDKGKTDCKIASLQVGYKRNKHKYKFTELEYRMDLFLAAKKIWEEEASTVEPLQIEYPLSLKLDFGKNNEDNNSKTNRKVGTEIRGRQRRREGSAV